MKKRAIIIALLSAVAAMGNAQANEFDGFFAGVKFGDNRSNITGTTPVGGKDTTTYGIEVGRNWDVNSYLVGVNVFLDNNSKVDHSPAPAIDNFGSNAYGVDLKLGLPKGKWLPYVHVGYSQTNSTGRPVSISGGDLHGGVGIEYKFARNWSVNGEWSGSSATTNGSKLNNDNATIGLRYYFSEPPAPAPVVKKVAPPPAPAPVVAPAPAPEPAPKAAPVKPKESWKTVLTEKPVMLEGANFKTSSSKLLKTADVKLSDVLAAAKQHPEITLNVSGHTDNRGKKAYNQKLSMNRAAAVKAYLVKHGIAADRINTEGLADTQPVADNKTAKGRAANRRVEIRYVIREETKVRVTE